MPGWNLLPTAMDSPAEELPPLLARQTPALQARQTRNAPPPPVRPEPPRRNPPPDGPRFAVRVLDNSVNTYQEVIGVCCAALGVSQDEGYEIARTIDTLGSCVVCEAPEPEAQRIAEIIGTIGIEVRLEPTGPAAPLPN